MATYASYYGLEPPIMILGKGLAPMGLDFPLDTTAMTTNNVHVIWLPGDYEKIEEKIFDHCVSGNNFTGVMHFSTTRSGNIFWKL